MVWAAMDISKAGSNHIAAGTFPLEINSSTLTQESITCRMTVCKTVEGSLDYTDKIRIPRSICILEATLFLPMSTVHF